ncbi:MAG TPA: helix-turn-helix transcriptional regulator [Thermoanaerobaculia bacterium]|jgi:transcriptional regulator with XRE-family HTH domain|nr:helix-turn-helix transcriptional regulator [Thermoanaerobaculia bacterium]
MNRESELPIFPARKDPSLRDWRKRLRHAIDLTRRTQASIAAQAGVNPETLSRVLSGVHAQPAFETVVRITHATGETIGWLLREPQTFLSTDDSAQMRQFIDFLESKFAPRNRRISRLD